MDRRRHPPEPALGAFGEKLRKQREQRGLALDAISNTTKISTRMLRALEEEHFEQLPGGVFNKGFVRAYARQVGLDEEEAITDYLAALRESQVQQQAILPDFRASAQPEATVASEAVHASPPEEDRPKLDSAGNHDGKLLRSDDRRRGDRRNSDRRARSRMENEKDSSPANLVGHLSSQPATQPAAVAPAAQPAKKYPAGDVIAPSSPVSAQIPWGRLAVALLLVTLALAFWNFRHRREPAAESRTAAATETSPVTPPATPAPENIQPADAGSPAGTSSSAGPRSSQAPIAATSQPELSSQPTSSAAAGIESKGSPKIEDSARQNAKSTPSPAPAPVTPTSSEAAAHDTDSSTASARESTGKFFDQPGARRNTAATAQSTFTVLIRAEKTTWVAITADGQPVARETLIAPAHTAVRATHDIVVRAGNAGGVSFLLNGKEVPTQGNEGEVKTYVFEATGVREAPQTP